MEKYFISKKKAADSAAFFFAIKVLIKTEQFLDEILLVVAYVNQV